VSVFSLSYPAYNGHGPYYYYLWPVRLYRIFPHYLIQDKSSEKKITEHKMCFETILTLRRIERDMIKIYFGIYMTYRYSSQVLLKLDFFYKFSKNTISNLMKIRPLGAELFYVDGRTCGEWDIKLIVSFRNFANTRNNNYVYFV
jgi:hypothetical protein